MKRPKIVISSLDLKRLENILDSLSHAQSSNVEKLEAELARAKVVEPEKMPANVVTMNSKVKFRVASSDKEFSYTLVYPKNAVGDSDKISILAPVGSALLGLKEGDEIAWPKPSGGDMTVHIIEVSYQPERDGNYHL